MVLRERLYSFLESKGFTSPSPERSEELSKPLTLHNTVGQL